MTPDRGWYHDPQGAGLRWWDGEGWTEHVQPYALPEPVPTPDSIDSSFLDTRLKVLALFVVVGLIAILGSVLLLSSAADDDASDAPDSPAAAEAETDDALADENAQAAVGTAQVAIEAFATDNAGNYTGATVEGLAALEPTLTDAEIEIAVADDSYTLTAVSASGNTFSITRTGETTSISCTDPGVGGCGEGGTW